MKVMTKIEWTALVLLITFAAVAAVAATGSARIDLNSDATLNGSKLTAGSYKISWTGSGDSVDVVFKNGKQEIKTSAKVVELKKAPARTSIVKNSDGSIREIWFGGKTSSLVFAQ